MIIMGVRQENSVDFSNAISYEIGCNHPFPVIEKRMLIAAIDQERFPSGQTKESRISLADIELDPGQCTTIAGKSLSPYAEIQSNEQQINQLLSEGGIVYMKQK